MLNHISIQGRLTADPVLRYTQSGTPVASFTLACDRDFLDSNGQRGVDFIDCVAWRNTGEFAQKYFAKGQMAVVHGRLQLRDYVDRENIKRRIAEINVDSMYFCGKKEENGGGNSGSRGSYQAAKPADVYAPPEFEELDDDDGELPF